eukprot:75243-Ditylum_brightwellii.AAC.1
MESYVTSHSLEMNKDDTMRNIEMVSKDTNDSSNLRSTNREILHCSSNEQCNFVRQDLAATSPNPTNIPSMVAGSNLNTAIPSLSMNRRNRRKQPMRAALAA